MKKAYICPEGHSLLVDEAVSMNGHCSACHTDYPLYLLTLDKKKKEDKISVKKETPVAKPKAVTKPKITAKAKPLVKNISATKPAIAAGEKTVEIPATTSPTKPATKKPAAKKTTKKKKK